MNVSVKQFAEEFISQENLPQTYYDWITRYWVPLTCRIQRLIEQAGQVPVIGINGAQGTGKSTCSACLAGLLKLQGIKALVLSIDDLYLTKSERIDLANTVHPLFITRGVPGTHDVKLGQRVIDSVRGADGLSSIPRFNKAQDDRSNDFTAFPEDVDVILLEGWCIGAKPESPIDESPLNSLEADEDSDGLWRGYVNEKLRDEYTSFFEQLDYLVMLKAPSFEQVYEWRGLQEQKLRSAVSTAGGDLSATMDETALQRFIAHYERLTRWMLDEMPGRADEVFELDAAHHIQHHTMKKEPRFFISTDLDATLLTEDYTWSGAEPALKELSRKGAYVCLNSSKTMAEMKSLFVDIKSATGLQDAPMIAENGGLVALPSGDIKIVGKARSEILSVAHALRKEEAYQFVGFDDWNPQDLMDATGLDEQSAKYALNRHATEPILWQDSEDRWTDFEHELSLAGIRAVRGGQFTHLMGQNDKVTGMEIALKWCSQQDPDADWQVIALGDSPNDLAMLNAADTAVAIRNTRHGERLQPEVLDCINPEAIASDGWNQAIKSILKRRK